MTKRPTNSKDKVRGKRLTAEAMKERLRSFVGAKAERERWDSQAKEDQSELVLAMRETGRHTIAYVDDDDHEEIVGTLVESSTVATSWEELRALVTDDQWAKILEEPQPSTTKLEAAVALGIIDADIVAKASKVHERSPYIRVTTKKITS